MSARALKNVIYSKATKRTQDFFGIQDITSKEVAGCFKASSLTAEDRANKYKPLQVKRTLLKNVIVEHDVIYGKIMFDKENVPTEHGQFEVTNEKVQYETADIKHMFEQPNESNPPVNELDVSSIPGYNLPYRIVDVEPTHNLGDVLNRFELPTAEQLLERYNNQPPLVFFFSEDQQKETAESREAQIEPEIKKLSGKKLDQSEIERCIAESEPSVVKTARKSPLGLDDDGIEDEDRVVVERMKLIEKIKELEGKYQPKKPEQNFKNAFDFLKQVRAGRIEPTAKGLKHRLEKSDQYQAKSDIKLDSRGFHIYTHQVPDWTKTRRVEILEHVKKSIIYHNYDILAFNKPYGIASHIDDQGKDKMNMNTLVQELAPSINVKDVYLAHRLDKNTTGVLVFATSQERARQLNKLFAAGEVKKTYWCITKNVPDPLEAIIDIPIGEQVVGGLIRGMVAPEGFNETKQLARRYREARRAVTEYKVLNYKNAAALVEVKPRTGVKHQIRVHMAFGISCAILGDHKYSRLDKIAPQSLPTSILNAMHVRKAKVRTIPMHLHSKSIVLPGVKANGETLFINAPLPPHFIANLKTLKLADRDIVTESN